MTVSPYKNPTKIANLRERIKLKLVNYWAIGRLKVSRAKSSSAALKRLNDELVAEENKPDHP